MSTIFLLIMNQILSSEVFFLLAHITSIKKWNLTTRSGHFYTHKIIVQKKKKTSLNSEMKTKINSICLQFIRQLIIGWLIRDTKIYILRKHVVEIVFGSCLKKKFLLKIRNFLANYAPDNCFQLGDTVGPIVFLTRRSNCSHSSEARKKKFNNNW